MIEVIGSKLDGIDSVAKKYSERFSGPTRPSYHRILSWLKKVLPLPDLEDGETFVRGKIARSSAYVAESGRLKRFHLPTINTLGELCDFLQLDSMEELDWLVAPNKFHRLRMHHYQTQLVKKRSGQFRLVEAPRSRLKFVQRMVLHEILDHIPVSAACFGFVKGRNVQQFASMHCGQGVVIRLDLEDFFPNIATSRVHALWRTLGYADQVATHLTWLCSVPPRYLTDEQFPPMPAATRSHLEEQCRRDRLPQGAPTSGALANLIAYRMDQRFVGLARKSGGCYSRYADDLAFSWPQLSDAHCERLIVWISATILECGFRVNFHKTRIMRSDQRQTLAGVVVNDQPNIHRDSVETLRAILFNCVRFGPESQNREGHTNFKGLLRGKIGWVEQINPNAGRRLLKIYHKIGW